MEADAAQLRCPAVLPVVEQFRHQGAEAAGHRVKVGAAGGLVLGKLGKTRTDGIALTWPAQSGLGGAVVQQGAVAQRQQIMVILPFVLGIVVMQRHAQVGTVVGGAAGPPVHAVQRVHRAAAASGGKFALALIQAAQQQVQKGEIVAQRKPPPQPVQRVDAAAQPAVGGAVARLRLRGEGGVVRDHISKHGSTLFDELGAAAGAGDLDAAPAPGHPQLLAALGAAVVVVELAVVPLVTQAAEFAADAVLHGVVSIVLLGALGDVAAEHPVVAEAQQHHADIQQQRKPAVVRQQS